MIARNLTLFRFPASMSVDDLEEGLGECQLKPVGPLELSSRGFIPPMGRDTTSLACSQGKAHWLSVGADSRLLPASVVNDLLHKKLAELEKQEGRKPGGRTRKRIKDELVTELLPRAFVKSSRTDAILDADLGIVAIDTSSRKAAENVVSEIRRALGSFPALPLNAEVAPRMVLTGWVAGDALPEGLSLGAECELRDPADSAAVVKVANMELQSDEIAKHLESGKQVTRLALNLDDHASFVIGEDLVLRKFKLLDGALSALESTERDDILAELDARFALFAGELRRLFPVLQSAFSLSTP